MFPLNIIYAILMSFLLGALSFPKGAIISMPLRANGQSRLRAFIGDVLSGIVEPISTILSILAANLIVSILLYLLSAAADTMMNVVVEEPMPEISAGEHSNIGVVSFVIGFTLMMALDTALG